MELVVMSKVMGMVSSGGGDQGLARLWRNRSGE